MSKRKNNNKWRILKNNCYMLTYIFKFTPGLLIYSMCLNVLTAITEVIGSVYTITYVLQALEEKQPIHHVLIYIAGFLGVNLCLLLARNYYQEVYYVKKKLILIEKMQYEIYDKATKMDIACYDNPSFYNDFVLAMEQSEQRSLQILATCAETIKIFIAIVSTSAIIFSLDWMGVVVVLFSFGINLLCNSKRNKLEYERDINGKRFQRRRDYTNRVFYQTSYIKEIRLSDIEDKMIEDFQENNKNLIDNIMYYAKKLYLVDVLSSVLSKDFLLNGVFMIVLSYKAIVLQSISYAFVAGTISGMSVLQVNLTKLSEILPKFVLYSDYIERFCSFLNYKNKIKDKDSSSKNVLNNGIINLNHVSFSYPFSEKQVLKDINMTINPGEKVAIVGYNGSGKSTLIKLLLRLYDVEDGQIIFAGKDIRDYDTQSYREIFSTVFQDFQLFATSIAENVIMDRYRGQEQIVHNALQKCELGEKIEILKNGIDTVLTKEYEQNGINLSGGEAQKVAISRVFASDKKIIVLDEPSSALDPVAEYNINQQIMENTNEKTVIFISHRLSTTIMADRIFMMEDGEIIEEGTHAELMYKNGKYAKMFNMQAEKYNV